jgi:hypothetical protein
MEKRATTSVTDRVTRAKRPPSASELSSEPNSGTGCGQSVFSATRRMAAVRAIDRIHPGSFPRFLNSWKNGVTSAAAPSASAAKSM